MFTVRQAKTKLTLRTRESTRSFMQRPIASIHQPGARIRLLIAEDHAAIRAGLRSLLSLAGDVEIVGEATDGPQALELVKQHSPDILLLDVEMPLLRGDMVLSEVLRDNPDIRVLVVSSTGDTATVKRLLAMGAAGYLLKDDVPSSLVTAVRSVSLPDASAWLSPALAKLAAQPNITDQALTWRELAIMQYLVEGWTPAEIGTELNFTERQLTGYIVLLMQKFETPSLNALIEVARQMLGKKS